jgi:regulatory protein, merR
MMNRHDRHADPSGRPQGKRISDAAREAGIAAHVLRHWEDEGILKPMRDSLGHRRYRPEDLSRAAAVRRAQDAGFTLEQIRRFIRATAQDRKALLNDHRSALSNQRERLTRAIGLVEGAMRTSPNSSCPYSL